MAAEVRLVDLAVIKRYSLAVRQERAPAEEVLTRVPPDVGVVTPLGPRKCVVEVGGESLTWRRARGPGLWSNS